MADEQVPATTPEPEQAVEAQPAAAPDPRDEELAKLRDDKQRQQASYSDLQRKYQLQYERNNASTALMSEMAENVRLLRESQTALVKSTMGEEQATALDARMKASTEDSQRRAAAQQAMTFIEAQTRVMTESLQAAGVDTRTVDWTGGNAASVAEWQERVKTSVLAAIGVSREKYLKAVESASTRAKEAAAVEATKLADKELAKAGVGRIDSAKGPGTTTKQRIDAMDPKSPEFAQMIQQGLRGELKKL